MTKYKYTLQEHRHEDLTVNHILDSDTSYDVVKYPGETSFGFLAQEDDDDADADALFRISTIQFSFTSFPVDQFFSNSQ